MPTVQGIVCIPLTAGFIALLILGRHQRRSIVWSRAWLILWPVSAFLLFALVAIESRYVAPFLVLFWLALYQAACPAASEQDHPPLRKALLITAVGIAAFLVPYLAKQMAGWKKENQVIEKQIVVAAALK